LLQNVKLGRLDMTSKRISYQLADVIELMGGGTPKNSVPEYSNMRKVLLHVCFFMLLCQSQLLDLRRNLVVDGERW
jgi:hypothetical protein